MSENNDTSLLALDNVYKEYSQRQTGAEGIPILSGITLDIQAGQSLAVVGPSGSGKSTLLNLMGGLDYPSAGSVSFKRRDLAELPEKDLARFRNQEIGFVFQLHHLLPQCTVWENILVPTLPFDGSNKDDLQERAEALLDQVGLYDRRTHRPAELSGGERQRVAVVRSLINGPSLLLADEPTGSLDQETAGELIDLLVELNETQHITLVVVTHADELARRMNKVYWLRNGELRS